MRRVAGIFFLLLLAFSFSSLAQTTGAIVGFVTDDAGAPLPGATVEARGPALQGTKITVTANDGSYRLPLLPPESVALAVMVCVPGLNTLKKMLPVPIRPSMLEYQTRLAERSPSSVSVAVPAKMIGKP